MKNAKYNDALSGLSTAPVGSPLRTIRDLNTSAAEWDRAVAATNQISAVYPTTFFVLGDAFLFNGAFCATWSRNLITTASHPLGVYWSVVAANANDLDEYTLTFPLAAGDYYLEMFWVKSTANGKFDVYFDGVAISTGTDGYAGSTTYNNQYLQAFNCASDGNHTLMVKINGKTGTDYLFWPTNVQISQQ